MGFSYLYEKSYFDIILIACGSLADEVLKNIDLYELLTAVFIYLS
jgi:hypothetical protein